MKATLFHNADAGGALSSKDELLDALHWAGFFPCYCSTKAEHFDETLGGPMDLAIVAAGDGTVAKIVTRLANRGIPIAIIPLGTANNIARSLGIAGSPLRLAETWRPDHLKRLTIGQVAGPWGNRPFIEAVGLGVIPEALRKVGKVHGPDKVRKGRQAIAKTLRKAKPVEADIKVDGQPLAGDVLAFEVTNISFVGPALPIAPSADPGDEEFEIVCVRTEDREHLLDWLDAPQKAPFPIPLQRARAIEIDWDDALLRLDDVFLEPPARSELVKADLTGGTVDVFVNEPPARRLAT